MDQPPDVAAGGHPQGGKKRRYKESLTKSLKQLQINPVTLAQDKPAWRRSEKTGAAIYEAIRIAAAKAKRASRKSQAPLINTANAQALPTCPRSQRIFRARIGRVGHLRTQCNKNPTTSTSNTPATDPMTTTTPNTGNNFINAPPPTITDAILLLPPCTDHHLPHSQHLSRHL
ncbi:unnamed protein product [Schistocephalus solidus]|uniref:Uncharacterized protein n=1 Tax=Schistocephalus solidus TaxID=70667 RepID=A0A183TEJ5_SCHSO|nr:unnamed protein product [Schistocephalus solidus]